MNVSAGRPPVRRATPDTALRPSSRPGPAAPPDAGVPHHGDHDRPSCFASLPLYLLRFDGLVRLPQPLRIGAARAAVARSAAASSLTCDTAARPGTASVEDLNRLDLVFVVFEELPEVGEHRARLLQSLRVEPGPQQHVLRLSRRSPVPARL